MERRIILVAIIEENGNYLLTRQSSEGRQSGLWGFPGGNLDNDETDLGEALCREVLEEVGLRVSEYVLLGAHVELMAQKLQLLFLYYLVETRKGDINLGPEIEKCEWMSLDALEDFNEGEIRQPIGWFKKAVDLLK